MLIWNFQDHLGNLSIIIFSSNFATDTLHNKNHQNSDTTNQVVIGVETATQSDENVPGKCFF